jgi:hypothetical protein
LVDGLGTIDALKIINDSIKLKEYLVHLAKTKLIIVMGDMYFAVVATRLTCLDKDNGFGDED